MSHKGSNSAIKASFALMITQFIQKGLSLITEPIFTRLLTTQEYGQVTLFLSWHEILMIFSSLCLSRGVFNNGMLDYEDDRDVYSFSLYCLTVISSLIIGAGVILAYNRGFNFMHLPIQLIILMIVILATEESFSMWTVRQRYEYKYKAVSVITVVLAVLAPLTAFLAILNSNNKVFARLFGEKTVSIIISLAFCVYLAIRARGKINTQYWKYALKFNVPIIPHYLSLHILNHTDRIMIGNLINSSAAGIYGVAYSGAAAIKIFWQAINASLIPWTYEKCSQKDYKALSEITTILLSFFGIMCTGFMFVAPEVMSILAPASYRSGVYVIPPIIVGMYYSALYYIFANVVYYFKKPKYVMIGSCSSAILNLLLNWLFIPKYGFIAAGYTTAVAYLVQAIIDYYGMKAVVGPIYNLRFLVLSSLGIAFIALLLNIVYDYRLLRMMLFVGIALFFLAFINNNKQVIDSVIRRGKNK